MNQELLRHFREISEVEQELLDSGPNPMPAVKLGDTLCAEMFLEVGKQVIAQKNARFVHVPEHTHDFVEIVYEYTGQTTHRINGGEVILHPGELLVLNQHARQEILRAGEDDIAVNFIVLPHFFKNTLGMMGSEDSALRKFLLGCLLNEDQGSNYLHFKVADVLPIQSQIEILLWMLVHNVPNRRSINQFAMGLLFLHLLNHTDKIYSGSKQDTLTFRILQYVEENYADGTLDDLAKKLGYNMSWLSRDIKRLTGYTFKELQMNKRISQAKFLLGASKMPVASVAKQIGYSNISYFYRLFQRQVGCSPNGYREKNQYEK